ncbi:hypothetical protein NPIL_524601 [Nephila pilipes]|uniref:Uncharacterized protein n=1 Tax=Nephila pilipes TaxID=299642 RepID=A0A8X6QVG1_NEPPI|nr:hypothetical protein NPIL_524601 [Nephila pilipes]
MELIVMCLTTVGDELQSAWSSSLAPGRVAICMDRWAFAFWREEREFELELMRIQAVLGDENRSPLPRVHRNGDGEEGKARWLEVKRETEAFIPSHSKEGRPRKERERKKREEDLRHLAEFEEENRKKEEIMVFLF